MNQVLKDTAAVPRCHPLLIRHALASSIVFTLNLTFSSYEEFQKHLESYQQNNPLFLRSVSYCLPGKASFKLCLVDYVMLGLVRYSLVQLYKLFVFYYQKVRHVPYL